MGSLRLLLALTVAGGHAASMFGFTAAWIIPGSRAVQIFYVISGFLMAMILNGKYADTPRGNWIFYTNRAIKIFAPYLTVLVVTVAICLVSKALTGNPVLLSAWFSEAGTMTPATWVFGILTNIFIVGQEWAFMLVYRAGSLFYDLHAFEKPPIASQFIVVVPAWTLSIELLFYVVAPFILRRNVLFIAVLAYASYRFRWDGYHFGLYSEATNYRFFPFELSLFLYGAICFRLGKALVPSDPAWTTTIVLAVIATIIFPRYFRENQYELYAIIGVLLPALFDFSHRKSWDQALGDLSYPLYVVHWPVLAFAAALAGSQPVAIAAVCSITAVLFAVFLAAIINRYIAIPVDVWRQERAGKRTFVLE